MALYHEVCAQDFPDALPTHHLFTCPGGAACFAATIPAGRQKAVLMRDWDSRILAEYEVHVSLATNAIVARLTHRRPT